MKRTLYKATLFLSVLLLVICNYSCNDMLDVKPDNVLTTETAYKTLDDANRAVLGIYSQLYTIADQYIVLNELRGDLLDVTQNFDKNLSEVNKHHVVSDDNPYTDPRPFYFIINSCNDVIKNLGIMKEEHRIKDLEYNERVSDIIAVRCWLYMQLGIHFGEIPYITRPFEQVSDIKNPAAFPKLNLSELLDTLLYTMQNIPVNTPYTTLSATFDGITMGSGSWIDKRFLLAELYLWNDEYFEAAKLYRGLMNAPVGTDNARYRKVVTLNWYSGRPGYDAFYTNTSNIFRDENVWCLFFNPGYSQNNSFVDLFSPNGGKYLLKPSKLSVDNWCLVPSQDDPGPNIDPRGQNIAWTSVNGNPAVYKSIISYNSGTPYIKPGRWWIWRMEKIHLHYSECVNRLNHNYLAWVLANNGMVNYHSDTTVYRNYLNSTFRRTNEPFPYNFSGIQTSDVVTVDKYNIPVGDFVYTGGIRGRAQMPNIAIPDTINGLPTDSTSFIEEMILDESGLELAYEGYRWPDLVRIAMRRNDPAILADRIYRKFLKNNDPDATAIRTKLMDPDNWFLPFPEK